MSSIQQLVTLGENAEAQHGYVTTTQALNAGLTRQQLARLSTAGALNRVAQGIYRMVGAAPVEQEVIYGAFLALSDRVLPTVGSAVPPLVVAGESATLLHGIGGYWGEEVTFISSYDFHTKRADVSVSQRTLSYHDVVFVQGMPVLSGSATIADLVRRDGDLSIVSDALMDALAFGLIDLPALATSLDPLAHPEGFADGVSFASSLIRGTNFTVNEVEFYVDQLMTTTGRTLAA